MKCRRDPKVALCTDKKRTREAVREVASTSSLCPGGRASQTPVRIVVASVCEVKSNAPQFALSETVAPRLLEPRLPRERHRPLGDGRLQPDAGRLPLRPARTLRLRPGAEDRWRREQRARRPSAALPQHRAADPYRRTAPDRGQLD